MTVFSRIIELPETQCLLVKERDEEEDAYKVNVTIEADGVRVTQGLGFYSEEQANKCFDAFTSEQAKALYDSVQAMLIQE